MSYDEELGDLCRLPDAVRRVKCRGLRGADRMNKMGERRNEYVILVRSIS
jgi:hypothetical protein